MYVYYYISLIAVTKEVNYYNKLYNREHSWQQMGHKVRLFIFSEKLRIPVWQNHKLLFTFCEM
jgi:hypothetical protein